MDRKTVRKKFGVLTLAIFGSVVVIFQINDFLKEMLAIPDSSWQYWMFFILALPMNWFIMHVITSWSTRWYFIELALVNKQRKEERKARGEERR